MLKKYDTIKANEPLHSLLPDLELLPSGSAIIARSEKYLAVGCDLRELDKLENVLRTEFDMSNTPVAILFTAEVSVAYMTLSASNAVFKWASKFSDVRFCLLEQQIPDGRDHPFAQTMLKHFEKLRTPLHSVDTIEAMKLRFREAGWPAEGLNIRSLWELWGDDAFLTPKQRIDLDAIEPFDEWEEFALFGSHYFLLDAQKRPGMELDGSSAAVPEVTAARDADDMAVYTCLPLSSTPSHRRFAAIVPSLDTTFPAVGLHGGLGTRERLNNCDTYTCAEITHEVEAPKLPTGIMCHTITSVNGTGHLLVGGRTSPDKASAACWYQKDGAWAKVHDLPEGRFRHCAVSMRDVTGVSSGVLIFGGRNSVGEVLGDWLMWTQRGGWIKVKASGPTMEPRFGAAIALCYGQSLNGVITGGLRHDGTVINDLWRFEIVEAADGNITVSLEDCTAPIVSNMDKNSWCLGRFGAVLVPTPSAMLLVGGVAADNLLGRTQEILDLDSNKFVEIGSDNRPLLTGFCAAYVGGRGGESQRLVKYNFLTPCTRTDISSSDVLIIGGGATCFSFGTKWNDGCVLSLGASQTRVGAWHLITTANTTTALPETKAVKDTESPSATKMGKKKTKGKKVIPVPRRTIESTADFELIRNEGRPVILSRLNLGPCTDIWTNDYLKSHVGDSRPVVVHSSPTPHMSFQAKNFDYKTQPFGEFLDAATDGGHLYLRTLSAEKPSDKPTTLAEDFPSIAADFQIPEELQYAQDHMHSSPFRISGPVTMWLHYDVMANIYCQIRGRKRLLVFPPTEVSKLSFPAGASSSTMNPFTDAHSAQAYEASVQPGDVLFIPPMWLHAAEPTEGLSVAVNVFFRDGGMEAGYAAGRDVYGNRDLAAYERGRRDVQKINKAFEGLPEDVRKFYLARLADELKDLSRI